MGKLKLQLPRIWMPKLSRYATKKEVLIQLENSFSKIVKKVQEWNVNSSPKLKSFLVEGETVENGISIKGTTLKNARKRWNKFKGETFGTSDLDMQKLLSLILETRNAVIAEEKAGEINASILLTEEE